MNWKRHFLWLIVVSFLSGAAQAYTFTAQNTTGNCEAVDVVVPVNVDNAAGMAGFKFDLVYDPSLINAVSATTTALTSGWIITSNTTLQPNRIIVAAASATLPIAAGSGAFVNLHFSVLAGASGTSALDLQNAIVNETTAAAMIDGTFTASCIPGVPGDVDGNGVVAPPDIFYLVNYLFASGAIPLGPADANGDGSVNTTDVFFLINYLFAGGPAPQ